MKAQRGESEVSPQHPPGGTDSINAARSAVSARAAEAAFSALLR